MPDGIILVVEDDSTLQMLSKMVIQRLGHECEVVGSGEEAIERDSDDIALIFMDVGLPGIQGGQATMLIREKELSNQRRRVPIIGLTGHAMKEQCLESGMDDYLQKPALLNDFRVMLGKWLMPVQDADK